MSNGNNTKERCYACDKYYLYVLPVGRLKHEYYAWFTTERKARKAVKRISPQVKSYKIIAKDWRGCLK